MLLSFFTAMKTSTFIRILLFMTMKTPIFVRN